MKTLFLSFCVSFVLFSCKGQSGISQVSPPDELLYDYEMVFKSNSGFNVITEKDDCQNGFADSKCNQKILQRKDSIRKYIKRIDSSIHVPDDQIRVLVEVSVYLKGLKLGQLNKLKNSSYNSEYELTQSIEIQAKRPIMQTEYLEQAKRPQMQEQMRYDSIGKSSIMVQRIGGGEPQGDNPSHRVWIIDTGIDSSHQDIKIFFPEDTLSKDFANSGKNPFIDSIGHGTFLAGVIGGIASSEPEFEEGYGVNGVYPGAKMVSLKVFDKKGKSNTSLMKSALEYVYQYGSQRDIVNLSLGYDLKSAPCGNGPVFSFLASLVGKGISIVMSAGNDGNSSTTNFPGCVNLSSSQSGIEAQTYTIGSIEMPLMGTYWFSSFSNYGIPSIDYLEPGEQIFTTAPGGKYVVVSGTSISAAIFSGILYHNQEVGILGYTRRGNDGAGGPDPIYKIGKINF